MSKSGMSKKDFEQIAVALKDGRDALQASLGISNGEGLRRVQRIHASTCGTVAGVLAKQNARFDRAKFLAACGVSPANTI